MENTTTTTRKVVEIVDITELLPVYRDGVEAISIELINFNFLDGDECGFDIIAMKGVFSPGDKGVYIQPDYCLPDDVPLFKSFTEPNGDRKKSKLGKKNRIRAIKFNFSKEPDDSPPIYSEGIILSLKEVISHVGDDTDVFNIDLSEALKIVKYVEDPFENGRRSRNVSPFNKPFPSSIAYKTDEPNIKLYKSKLKKHIDGKRRYGITIKRDGSSFSLFTMKNENGEYENIICSRNFAKNVIMISESESEDIWVNIAFQSGLYHKAIEYCKKHDIALGFRGEIIGQSMKGSGNKRNPDSNSELKLILFGVDVFKNGQFRRLNYNSEHNLKKVAEEIGIEYTEVIEIIPNSFDELMGEVRRIINDEKDKGRMIEGVVIRSMDSNYISVKYINPEYDSYK